MKKKFLSLVLALVMVLSMLPATASAAEVVASGYGWDVAWVLTDDGTLTVYGTWMTDQSWDFVAPWYDYAELIQKVVIAEGNGRIDMFAFADLPNLTEVFLPESLTRINASAFAGCEKLTSIHIPAGVDKIGEAAFSNCASMTEITVAEENAYYASVDGALTDKAQTELIQVPGGVSGTYTIPDSITEIQPIAFMGCHKLTEVVFPDMFEELPGELLRGLDRLITVKLPASLTAIPRAAFFGCEKLAYLEIPASVTAVEESAFDRCTELSNLVFRGNAPAFGDQVFYQDTLTAWYPAGNAAWTESVMQNYGGDVTWKSFVPLPFGDVLPFQFWYEPVAWAVEHNVTTGVSATEFGPEAACNRAQVVTFLWRAAGEPEPTVAENPFVDVQAGSFYEKAVLWAVETGITTGTDAAHFSPDQACNRATVVTFLHRAAGSPAAQNAENPFTDVPADTWYTEPVAWAVENGITNGMGGGLFGVETDCNRAQIVTFLYRAYK